MVEVQQPPFFCLFFWIFSIINMVVIVNYRYLQVNQVLCQTFIWTSPVISAPSKYFPWCNFSWEQNSKNSCFPFSYSDIQAFSYAKESLQKWKHTINISRISDWHKSYIVYNFLHFFWNIFYGIIKVWNSRIG